MTEYKISQVQIEGWVTWEPETPTVSRRILKFPDGTQVRVTGLDEIMEDFYRERKQVNRETAEEILDRLEKAGNYIPPSARKDYRRMIMKEYKDYISEHKKSWGKDGGIMKSNLIKEFLLIWIMVIFFILESTYSPAQESPKSLTILYTNNINGELEPCPSWGPAVRFGGLARRATWIKEIREREKGVLLVDSGDLFFKKFTIPPLEKERESLIQRAYLILKSLNIMEYHAIGIGDDDFTLGKEFLHELSKTSPIPFLSANVIDEDTLKPLFNRYIIKEINGLKIGIFSLLSPETFLGPSDPRRKGLVFEDPLKTARDLIQELSPQVDLLILLSHLGYHKDIELAQKTEGIHLIFGSHTGVDLVNPPIIKNTVILQNSSRGMYARKLNLTYLNKEASFYNEATKLAYQQNLQKYQRQLETQTASEAERKQWEKAVQNIKETLDQFSQRNAFRIISVPLSREFNDHPEISKMIEDYKSKFPEKVESPSYDSRGTYRPRP